MLDSAPGLNIIKAPENPAITAIHLGHPTFSLRREEDSAVTIIGAMYTIVTVLTNGILLIP